MLKAMLVKIILYVVATISFLLGCVGLMLPVIPQVPFFCVALVSMMAASKWMYDKFVNSSLFREKAYPYMERHDLLMKLYRRVSLIHYPET